MSVRTAAPATGIERALLPLATRPPKCRPCPDVQMFIGIDFCTRGAYNGRSTDVRLLAPVAVRFAVRSDVRAAFLLRRPVYTAEGWPVVWL